MAVTDIPVITVDGPSGSGKGSVSLTLTRLLGWHVLDSGAIYRVLAEAALQQGVDLDDEEALASLAQDLDVTFDIIPGKELQVVRLKGEDISQQIRTEQCGNAASRLAAYPLVRASLLDRQRRFRQFPGLIADGRDMGTVVFPDAPLKIFLSASAAERAKRRYKQLNQQGFSVNLARLSEEIVERDVRDQGRSHSPLKPAPDAVVLDTTDISIEQVVKRILERVRETFPDVAEQLPIN